MPYKDRSKQLLAQRENVAKKSLIRRFTVIEFLGGKCIVCSEDDKSCLQIDHIEPILRKRGDVRYGQQIVLDIYMDRIDLNDLQVLCANCHMRKTYGVDKYKFNYVRLV